MLLDKQMIQELGATRISELTNRHSVLQKTRTKVVADDLVAPLGHIYLASTCERAWPRGVMGKQAIIALLSHLNNRCATYHS